MERSIGEIRGHIGLVVALQFLIGSYPELMSVFGQQVIVALAMEIMMTIQRYHKLCPFLLKKILRWMIHLLF